MEANGPKTTTRRRIRRSSVYVATIVSMLAMVGGFALAAFTTTLSFPTGQGTSGGTASSSTAPGVTMGSLQTLTLGTLPGQAAGTQTTSTVGFDGTAQALCTTSGCTAYQDTQASGTNVPTAGDYFEEVPMTVALATTGSANNAFDIEIIVIMSSPAATAVGYGYLGQGAIPSSSPPSSIGETVFIDLGTLTSMPTITSVTVILNNCGSTTTCP